MLTVLGVVFLLAFFGVRAGHGFVLEDVLNFPVEDGQ